MIFLVLGETGCGKTNFINTLTKSVRDVEANISLSPGTRDVLQHTVERDAGRKLMFLDTPGLDNPNNEDEHIFMIVAKYLKNNFPSIKELGIIYLHRITDNPMKRIPPRCIAGLCSRLKGMSLHCVIRVCLVTTMWDDMRDEEKAEAETRENILKEGFQKCKIPANFERFDNHDPSRSAWDIANKLLTPDAMMFVVIGETGCGKTNFVNILTGSVDGGPHSGLSPGTRNVVQYTVECDNCGRLIFLDTPGLDAPDNEDEHMFMAVAKYLKNNFPSVKELGVIYLHRITDDPMKRIPPKCITELCSRLKGVSVHRVCLVTTMWDNVSDEDKAKAEEQEEQLKEELQKWKIVASFERFDNHQPLRSARDIAKKLVEDDGTLWLQKDLEDRVRLLDEASVGEAPYARLQELLLQRKEVVRQLVDQALTQGNQARVQELQAEHETLDAQMRVTLEEMRKKNISLVKRVLLWLSRSKLNRAKRWP